MSRLHCWMCTLLAVFVCLVAVPHSVFALEQTLRAVEGKIVVMEAKKAALEAAIARADAQTVAITGVKVPSVALVTVATFTAESPAEGWYAWKRQSAAYKQAHPWGKIIAENCARDSRICAQTAPAGTVFYLPAPEIRVMVPVGMSAPEAIAVVATATPGMFTLDTRVRVAIAKETARARQAVTLTANAEFTGYQYALIFLLITAVLFGVLYLLFFHLWSRASDNGRAQAEQISELGKRLDAARAENSKLQQEVITARQVLAEITTSWPA